MQEVIIDKIPRPNLNFRFFKWIIIAGLIIWLISSTFVFIPAGNVGALYDRGTGIQNRVLGEGLNLTIPFWQKVQLFDARLQEYTMTAAADEGAIRRDDSLDAPTSDGQSVKVDATVLFRIDKSKAPELWRTVGIDYVNKLIRPFSRSQIRMVISRYTAPEIYSEKRQEAEAIMTSEIAELLKDKNIIVDKVLLRAVYFSPEYSKAIEQKVIAEQLVKKAEFEVQQASQAAQAKVAEAKGFAEAQALQRQTLNDQYLQLEAIKKWNGVMPQVVGSGSTPFINIPIK
ncbi:prohibitin family protein [Candidatus Daviesbacteria bacterium]|nr:prohibitin family protein [Candidatus Daviesbacteria bacterium]